MRRHSFIIFILVSALAATAQAAAKGPIGLSASVDKKAVYIGDRIKYTVVASLPKGVEAQLPEFKDYKIGDFEIKESGAKERSSVFGRKIIRKWYYISIYATGKQTIPQIDVRYRKKGDKDWSAQKTPAIDINVRSVLPSGKQQPADIKDIKGPLSYRNIYGGILALVVALGIFLTIAIILYKRLKRYVPVRLPHETALEELEAIRASYLQGGDVKEYYVGVSDCVRRYIERAFKLRAPEMTTEEFLGSLRESPGLSAGQKDLLKGFLNACDMVKFAKYAPTRAEAESVYDTAKRFIEETARALSAPEPGGKA